ncbi:MAG TPA: hypothetical protein VI462_15735 [Acidimicrobiia bacterium]
MFGGGCGCLPDTVIRWLVFSVLLLGGLAIVIAGRRRPRAEAPDGRRRGTRAIVAGTIVAALGVLVAVGAPEADISLAFLAAGAVIATAGVAPTRRGTPVDESSADRAP